MSLFEEVKSTVDALQQTCSLPSGASVDDMENHFTDLAIKARNCLSLLFGSRFVSKEKAAFSWRGGKRNRGKNCRGKKRVKSEQQASDTLPIESPAARLPRSSSPPLLPSPQKDQPPPPAQTALPPMKAAASNISASSRSMTSDPRDTNPDRTVRQHMLVALSIKSKEERRREKKERRATCVAARTERGKTSGPAHALTATSPQPVILFSSLPYLYVERYMVPQK
uniref:Uncharacterized protein n=1 Tax=Chromera velia CCMP2878 TaxID=1169474 RepID=A0A0G4IBQ8_9ALVE|eukprot:Cvel_12890.t1-p1 / transcript=Cvel_12890.t1 / gene=Cvel_12890 / organism=Chromera_velia_CCMP2878 / gene_product=hypothetical protein / transcript_product=hypothetical protein / location=Cvel_scaffold861:26914-27585(+) / protein_length=224 / sequence_SO=supercontig / SO=protein_coding / is_pseudo=false